MNLEKDKANTGSPPEVTHPVSIAAKLPQAIAIYPDGRLDTVNAAAYIGLSVKTMAQWRYKGEGPPFLKPSGNKIFYVQSDLDAWINRFDRAASTSEMRYKQQANQKGN
jgi:hypothetical protein